MDNETSLLILALTAWIALTILVVGYIMDGTIAAALAALGV